MMMMFHEGGPSMFGLLCCGLIGNPLALAAVVAAFVAKSKGARIGLGAASLLVGGATLLAGVVAYFYWMNVVEDAVAFADMASRRTLYERGRAGAMNNLWLGAAASFLPLVLGAIGLVRGLLTPPPPPAP